MATTNDSTVHDLHHHDLLHRNLPIDASHEPSARCHVRREMLNHKKLNILLPRTQLVASPPMSPTSPTIRRRESSSSSSGDEADEHHDRRTGGSSYFSFPEYDAFAAHEDEAECDFVQMEEFDELVVAGVRFANER